MGKKQHQKDKLWLTTTEWKTIYGGKKANSGKQKYHKQPYYYCSLKYVPTTEPCCTKEGIVFDYENILNFLKKNKINPITGKKLKLKDILRIKFHRNLDGEIHCPITYKVFNDSVKIVVAPNSGNVFSYEGLLVNNKKGDDWFDPLTNEAFPKKDLIVIQDPENPDRFNMATFYKKNSEEQGETSSGPTLKISDPLLADVVKEMYTQKKKQKEEAKKKEEIEAAEFKVPQIKDKINEANYSTGMASASFTSTAAPVAYINEIATLSDDTVRYGRLKEKGYVSLVTNFGKINLELYCDSVPKTCDNFMRLCKSKYYNNTKFHRLIRHFVLQGGDPTGTGKGGESCWGKPFEDEFCKKYSHDSRGILSMANSGPNTNSSQFFIVLRPAKHLDKKHTIFGRVVGGMRVLDEIEMVESDNQDRPIEPIEILCTEIFVDPYEKVDKEIRKEREELSKEKIDESLLPKNRQEELEWKQKQISGTLKDYQSRSKVVGKYLIIPPMPDTASRTSSKKSSVSIGNKLVGGLVAYCDDDDEDKEESEYEQKIKRRRIEGITTAHLF